MLSYDYRGVGESLRGRLGAYCIEDDRFAPRRAVGAFLHTYPNARAELAAVRPRELRGERVGHFGCFRECFRDTLWRGAADWLAQA